MDSENSKTMMQDGLKCSFMAQNTIKQKIRQIEKIKDVLAIKLW